MDFRQFIEAVTPTQRAEELLRMGVAPGAPFSESTPQRKKLLIHLAATRISRGDKAVFNQVYSDLIRKNTAPRMPVIKPETPEELEARLRMQYGSDWDRD